MRNPISVPRIATYPKRTQDRSCKHLDDRINVIIENATITDVEQVLKPQWGTARLSGTQYLCDPDVCSKSRCKQDSQLRKDGPHRYTRYHVRLWHRRQIGDIVGAAHFEINSIAGGWHVVGSYESGKLELEADFRKTPWTARHDDEYLDNSQDTPYFANGYALRAIKR